MDSISIRFMGMDLNLDGEFSSGRAAPNCSNHDSAAFSDSGDPAEIKIVRGTIEDKNGKHVKLSKEFIEFLNDSVDVEALCLEALAEEAKAGPIWGD